MAAKAPKAPKAAKMPKPLKPKVRALKFQKKVNPRRTKGY